MAQDNQLSPYWWGKFELASGQTIQWSIGSLRLALERLPNEWQIAYDWDQSSDPETVEWARTEVALEIRDLDCPNVERYVLDQANNVLWIRPALADRPVITRPFTPLYVPADEAITVFVSTPLWVRIEVDDPPKNLQEVPIRRLSDTWFGPSTMEGELCYADRTFARLSLENIPTRVHRAITRVTILNKATTQLLIDRLSLPVPYLSLFETAAGLLWTQSVTMVRTRDTGTASLQIEADPPEQAKGAKPVGEPRLHPEQNMVVRAFEVLFR
jgi:hypothetical protein